MEVKNTKPAYVENIILWIIIFVSFATLFFFIIEYSVTLKIIDKTNALSDYGARSIALGNTDDSVVAGLNQIKGPTFSTITVGDLTCTKTTGITNYQVIFNTYTTYGNNFLQGQGANNIHAKKVIFNEVSSTEKICELYVTLGN
jgi:hypothetical protein